MPRSEIQKKVIRQLGCSWVESKYLIDDAKEKLNIEDVEAEEHAQPIIDHCTEKWKVWTPEQREAYENERQAQREREREARIQEALDEHRQHNNNDEDTGWRALCCFPCRSSRS